MAGTDKPSKNAVKISDLNILVILSFPTNPVKHFAEILQLFHKLY